MLAGFGVAAYIALRPAPTGTPIATSTAPAADTAGASSTPTSPAASENGDQVRNEQTATTTPTVGHTATNTAPETATPAPTATTSGFKTYRNEEWGFAFDYPEDWVIKENTFRSYSSRFNVVLQPKESIRLPEPVMLVVSFDDWAQRVFASVHKRAGTIATTTIQGFSTSYFETEEMGVPATTYLIQITNDRWFIVSGKTDPEYDKVLQHVLSSLEFSGPR